MKGIRSIKLILSVFIIGSMALVGCSQDKDTSPQENAEVESKEYESNSLEKESLIVYSGAGLKNAMEDIKTEFELKNDVVIDYVYGGATQLLSQMEISGKGDVFIAGSQASYKVALEKDMANEGELLAYHTPAIAVQKGNPNNISSLEDLKDMDIRIALGDKESNAIGVTSARLIEKNKLYGIEDNVVTKTATVNEIIMAIATGQVDAGIVTEDSVFFNEDIEVVEIPADENIEQIIPVCSLKTSEKSELADSFVEFVSSERGKDIFKNNGFEPVKE